MLFTVALLDNLLVPDALHAIAQAFSFHRFHSSCTRAGGDLPPATFVTVGAVANRPFLSCVWEHHNSEILHGKYLTINTPACQTTMNALNGRHLRRGPAASSVPDGRGNCG